LAKKFPAPQRWMVEEEMRLDIPFALDLPVSLLQTPTQNYSRRLYRASSNTPQSWVSHLRPAHLAHTCQRDEGLCGDRQAKKVIECWADMSDYSTQEIATAEVVARRLLERPVYAHNDPSQSQKTSMAEIL
jgi:hypothetical protein